MYATLLLGSNLGASERILVQARERISTLCGAVIHATEIVRSAPWGFDSAHDFYNQIIVIETTLAPKELLDKAEETERFLGRVKTSENWQLPREYTDRTIDIDILFYGSGMGAAGSVEYEDERLKIPHPHINDRPFTLALLAHLPNY